MAKRTTKSRTRQPKPPKQTSGPRTTEDLDDETLQALAFNHKKKFDGLEEERKAVAKKITNAKKLAKAEMGADALDVIDDLQQLETDAGELKLTTAVKRILRSARWAGSSLHTQFEMFNGPDRTPAVDRAHDAGKRAGMNGEPAKPPHHPNTEQYTRWMEGWQAGQEAHSRAGFKSMDPPKGSEPKEGADDEPQSGERVSRSEFQSRLAGNDEVADKIIKGQLGDQPSTATVQQH